MTDNEKRAHDLAIAYISTVMNRGEENPRFYEEYADMYKTFLTKINQDFPK